MKKSKGEKTNQKQNKQTNKQKTNKGVFNFTMERVSR